MTACKRILASFFLIFFFFLLLMKNIENQLSLDWYIWETVNQKEIIKCLKNVWKKIKRSFSELQHHISSISVSKIW